MSRTIVNTRKIEVILIYAKKNKSHHGLPRQECGAQGINWHSADTLGHIFSTSKIRLRMRNGKTTILQQSLTGCSSIVKKWIIVILFR